MALTLAALFYARVPLRLEVPLLEDSFFWEESSSAAGILEEGSSTSDVFLTGATGGHLADGFLGCMGSVLFLLLTFRATNAFIDRAKVLSPLAN